MISPYTSGGYVAQYLKSGKDADTRAEDDAKVRGIVEDILTQATARHEIDELTGELAHDLPLAAATLTFRFEHRPVAALYRATLAVGDLDESPTLAERYVAGLIAPVRDVIAVNGFSILADGSAPNYALGVAILDDWQDRPDWPADRIIGEVMPKFGGILDGQVIAINPPSIRGLGASGGGSVEARADWLEDRIGAGRRALSKTDD